MLIFKIKTDKNVRGKVVKLCLITSYNSKSSNKISLYFSDTDSIFLLKYYDLMFWLYNGFSPLFHLRYYFLQKISVNTSYKQEFNIRRISGTSNLLKCLVCASIQQSNLIELHDMEIYKIS
jgi:hypothetical protein